ncbi:hypothetical protein H4S07_006618, partial [Coemansia furcata]
MSGDESIASAPLAPEFSTKLTESNVSAIPISTTNSPTESTLPAAVLSEVLSNNEEYMVVYWAVEALKSQLSRAKSDMQILVSLRQRAFANPLEYVEALVADSAPRAPPPQAVVEVPSVYLEPYLTCADPAAIEEYMGVVQSVLSADDASRYRAIVLANKHAGSRVIKSTPLRHLPPAMSKAALRASRPPSSTNLSLLTGNTVVATPDHLPRRLPVQPSAGSIDSAALTAAPAPMPSSIPAADSDVSIAGVTPVAPVVARANTEPIFRAPEPTSNTRTTIATTIATGIVAERGPAIAIAS